MYYALDSTGIQIFCTDKYKIGLGQSMLYLYCLASALMVQQERNAGREQRWGWLAPASLKASQLLTAES